MYRINYNEDDLRAKYHMLKNANRTCFVLGFVLNAACLVFINGVRTKNVRSGIFPMVSLIIIALER